MKRDIVCIIPSRYESSRFPGKPLADLCGKPMIQHVYERVSKAKAVPYVAVATDDDRIFNAVKKFGGNAIMTAVTHRSGTDRIAEAVKSLNLSADAIVVNIQGDQPIFEPVQVDEVIQPLIDDSAIVMSTLIYKIILDEEITHPHAVKVAFDNQLFCPLFFAGNHSLCAQQHDESRLLQASRHLCLPPRFPRYLYQTSRRKTGKTRSSGTCSAHWNTATKSK